MKFEHTMVFETTNDLEEIFTYGNQKLSTLIVDVALKNLKTSINEIPVVSIGTKDDDVLYDIMIERPDMIETLEQNLEPMERYEDYERCAKIISAIDYLKSK